MNGIMVPGGELGERGVCERQSLPTSRYPLYATTIGGTLDGAGVLDLEFTPERDTLLTDIRVDSSDADARVNIEYCNTRVLVNSSRRNWALCCAERPAFLVGVAENKTLRIRITGTAAATASVTMNGYQGTGCCG